MKARLCLALMFLLAFVGPARACTIPVFRYALERWPASRYEVVVFQRGKFTPEAEAALRELNRPAAPANFTVKVIDLNGKVEADLRKVWERESTRATVPWMVSLYPDEEEVPTIAWAGPLTAKNVRLLLDSPARRQIVRHLAQGTSVVWVLLESGDARADKLAADLLARELARLEKSVKVPEQPPDGVKLLTELPLRVSFSVVSVSRGDRGEEGLVQALLNLGPKIAAAPGPVVFPVIGRGRAMIGLHGDKLTALRLEDWATFLCGACSCEVSEENPGTDLLLAANWETLLGLAGTERPRPDEPAKGRKTTPKSVAIPPGLKERSSGTPAASPPVAASSEGRWFWAGAGVVGVVALLAGSRLLRPRRGRGRDGS